jgi:hypothetical protein
MEYRQQQQLDLWLRTSGRLRTSRCALPTTVRVPGYATLDLRYAYRVDKNLEVALIGRNLVGARRFEYVSDYLATVSTAMQPSLMLTSLDVLSPTWRAPTPSIHPQRRAGGRHRAGHAGHLWRSHLGIATEGRLPGQFPEIRGMAGRGGTVNICLFGRDSLGPYLAGYEGRQIAGRELRIRKVSSPEQLADCQNCSFPKPRKRASVRCCAGSTGSRS